MNSLSGLEQAWAVDGTYEYGHQGGDPARAVAIDLTSEPVRATTCRTQRVAVRQTRRPPSPGQPVTAARREASVITTIDEVAA